ncbi:MAG: YihY/virulence factor BrkB family protein, partial [Deltaproteobacteria bacterium]
SLVGWVLGEDAAQHALHHTHTQWVDPRALAWIEDLVVHLQNNQGGRGATLAGTLFLLWSGTRLFAQLRGALNQLWRVRPAATNLKVSLLTHVYKQLLAVAGVLVLGGLLIAAILLSSAATVLKSLLGAELPGSQALWGLTTVGITVAFMACLFTFIYRCMPDGTVRLRDAWVGGTVTALLFTTVEYPLSIYLARQGVDTAYGAAASLVAFLVWVYYSAQIFFVGAQFTVVYAETAGRGIQPVRTGPAWDVQPPGKAEHAPQDAEEEVLQPSHRSASVSDQPFH